MFCRFFVGFLEPPPHLRGTWFCLRHWPLDLADVYLALTDFLSMVQWNWGVAGGQEYFSC